ncbi:hypothetical protein MW887_010747 [Aspergillus wentii]|nr:hypothetical protein MW887_010747 [Aspergillus wentii]
MPPRRTHHKSRHGCLSCKKKRVKCGEERPSCVYCAERGLVCEYASVAPLAWHSWNIKLHSKDQSLGPLPDTTGNEGNSTVSRDNLQDQEFMMQWCTSTYRSLSRNTSLEWIWQYTIPRESFQHAFLNHGILSLSALHLAITSHKDQRERYLKAAQHHHTHAVPGLLHAVGELHQNNSNAIYAASNVMIIFAFAFPLIVQPCQPGTALDDLFQVFHVVRSSMAVLQEMIDWVRSGILSPLISKQEDTTALSPELENVIHTLKKTNSTLNHSDAASDAAIEQLRPALGNMLKDEGATMTVFLWVFAIPAPFVEMLRARRPFAMVILAHYAVVMYHLRRFWWMGDWGRRVCEEIYDSLEPEWRARVVWVVDIIKTGA